MAAEQADTIIGAQVELKGSLRNAGPIHVFGKVEGEVTSDSLVVIGESANITGPISAKQVDIAGKVHGPISASETVELQAKSVVKGDISTKQLAIRAGATFNGRSQMGSSAHAPEPIESSEPDKKRPRLEIE